MKVQKEITFSTGRRFQIEKQLDQNERHKGEWKVMEWNKRSRDWDWHAQSAVSFHRLSQKLSQNQRCVELSLVGLHPRGQ